MVGAIDRPSFEERRPRPRLAAVWQWGFSIVALAIGLWLIVASPPVGAFEGRLIGYVVVAYALIRTVAVLVSRRRRPRPLVPDREADDGPGSC